MGEKGVVSYHPRRGRGERGEGRGLLTKEWAWIEGVGVTVEGASGNQRKIATSASIQP